LGLRWGHAPCVRRRRPCAGLRRWGSRIPGGGRAGNRGRLPCPTGSPPTLGTAIDGRGRLDLGRHVRRERPLGSGLLSCNEISRLLDLGVENLRVVLYRAGEHRSLARFDPLSASPAESRIALERRTAHTVHRSSTPPTVFRDPRRTASTADRGAPARPARSARQAPIRTPRAVA
jgi:hypothetical protein